MVWTVGPSFSADCGSGALSGSDNPLEYGDPAALSEPATVAASPSISDSSGSA